MPPTSHATAARRLPTVTLNPVEALVATVSLHHHLGEGRGFTVRVAGPQLMLVRPRPEAIEVWATDGAAEDHPAWHPRLAALYAGALVERFGPMWRPEAEMATEIALAAADRLAELARAAAAGVAIYADWRPAIEVLAAAFPDPELVHYL